MECEFNGWLCGDAEVLTACRRRKASRPSTGRIRFGSTRSVRWSPGQGCSQHSRGWRIRLITGRSSLGMYRWAELERLKMSSMRVSSWRVMRRDLLQEPTWRSMVGDASRIFKHDISAGSLQVIDTNVHNLFVFALIFTLIFVH